MSSKSGEHKLSATPINAAALQRTQWRRIGLLARWTNSRRVRRLVVVAWFALLALDVSFFVIMLRCNCTLHARDIALLLLPFALSAWIFQRIEIGLAHPTLEDRAALQYGEDFDTLKETQRRAVLDQQVRDNLLGAEHSDAREADLRTQAEASAYRILSRLMPVLMLLAFLATPWLPTLSPLFLATSIAIFACLIVILPMVIRIWTTPDPIADLRDPHLVNNNEGHQ